MPTRTASVMRIFSLLLFAFVQLALSAPSLAVDFRNSETTTYLYQSTVSCSAGTSSSTDQGTYLSTYNCTWNIGGFYTYWFRSYSGSRYVKQIKFSVCPTNSTLNTNTFTCSPNSGYSAVNNSGTWTVVASGSECSSAQIYNSSTGTCGDTNALTFASAAALAALAIFLGVSVGSLITAAGGLAAAAWLALIALTGGTGELTGTPQQDIDALKPPIIVDLNPPTSTPPTTNDDNLPKVVRNPDDKSLNPGGGSSAPAPSGGGQWTPTPSGEGQQYTPAGSDTPTIIIGRTPENNGDQVTIRNNPSDHSGQDTQTTIRSYDDDSLSIQYSGPVSTGATTNTGTLQRNYDTATSSGAGGSGGGTYTSFYFNPLNADGSGFNPDAPISPVPTAGNGNGTGDATGNGTGDGGEGNCKLPDGRSCASEQTLGGIKDALTGVGTNKDAALADFGSSLNAELDSVESTNDEAFADLDYEGKLKTALDSLDAISPWRALSFDQAASCTYTAPPIFGKPVTLSICDAQPTLHTVVAFFFFVLLSFGVLNLIFEKPE